MAAYSKRSADVDAAKRELIAKYEASHEGRAPDRATLYKLRKKATVETREAKAHPPKRTAEQETEAAARVLAEWMRQAENESVQLLESLPAAVDRFAAERGPSRIPTDAERARAIRVGVAEVQRQNATWTRGKLIWEIHRALGQLPASVDPVAYLEAMADDAVSRPAGGAGECRPGPAVPGGADRRHGDHPHSASAGTSSTPPGLACGGTGPVSSGRPARNGSSPSPTWTARNGSSSTPRRAGHGWSPRTRPRRPWPVRTWTTSSARSSRACSPRASWPNA